MTRENDLTLLTSKVSLQCLLNIVCMRYTSILSNYISMARRINATSSVTYLGTVLFKLHNSHLTNLSLNSLARFISSQAFTQLPLTQTLLIQSFPKSRLIQLFTVLFNYYITIFKYSLQWYYNILGYFIQGPIGRDFKTTLKIINILFGTFSHTYQLVLYIVDAPM